MSLANKSGKTTLFHLARVEKVENINTILSYYITFYSKKFFKKSFLVLPKNHREWWLINSQYKCFFCGNCKFLSAITIQKQTLVIFIVICVWLITNAFFSFCISAIAEFTKKLLLFVKSIYVSVIFGKCFFFLLSIVNICYFHRQLSVITTFLWKI